MEVLSGTGAVDSGELLERSEQLGALGDSFGEVKRHARGRVLLVQGEAGIGKTTLLRRFCGEMGPRVRVLWAACDPLYTPRPLGPLLDIARATGGELDERVERGDKPHDVADALIRELEAPSPTILVLEDLHWADAATLDVARLVARRVDEAPALFVASYRDEELGPTHPLRIVLGELPRDETVERVDLGGLSPEAVATLAAARGVDPDELFYRTSGNPFFVTEVLAAATERVPHTVRDAVLARASRLSDPARALLDAAAIAPERAELWLLEALVGGSVGDIGECLSSGMLNADGDRIGFRHELARLAIEESLAPDRRRDLHRSALAALSSREDMAPDLARLAHHAEAAGDAQAVLRLAPAAAEHARALGARREALHQYERALRFADAIPPPDRAGLLERFADEAYVIDMREEAIAALDEALAIRRATGDVIREGEILVLKARTVGCIGRLTESKKLQHEAVAVLERQPASGALARAYGLLAADGYETGEFQEAVSWGIRAIEVAEAVGDTQALIYSLNTVGSLEIIEGLPGGREKVERSIELAIEADLPVEAGRGYLNMIGSLGESRREWSLADQYFEPGIRFCRERGLEAWLECLLAGRAVSELRRGLWDRAAATATELANGRPSLVVEPRVTGLMVLGLLRARRADPDAWPMLDAAAEAIGDEFVVDLSAPVAAARAEAAWLEGKNERVADETKAALEELGGRWEPFNSGELLALRRRAGIQDQIVVEIAAPFSAELAGDHERAAELWNELDCPYDAALALAGSDQEDSLRRSLNILQGFGATAAVAIVSRRLRERGARRVPRGPRAATSSNAAGLTVREVEVLELVADGLRNADIAERLFLSEKTVGHHVSAILRKLDARNRSEAAATARRLGLVPSSPA